MIKCDERRKRSIFESEKSPKHAVDHMHHTPYKNYTVDEYLKKLGMKTEDIK